jgi:hypothetical protein
VRPGSGGEAAAGGMSEGASEVIVALADLPARLGCRRSEGLRSANLTNSNVGLFSDQNLRPLSCLEFRVDQLSSKEQLRLRVQSDLRVHQLHNRF